MWVDLTQAFREGVPHSPAYPPPSIETLADVRDDGVNVQQYQATTHVGTHIDAPRHIIPGGATIDDILPDRFVGEGVVLDVQRDTPEEISVDAVEAATGADAIEPGDMVLFYTGWGDEYPHAEYNRYPWLSAEVTEWVLDREVSLLGVDTPSPDRPRAFRPDGWEAYPIHRALLVQEVLIAENLVLGDVAGERVELFGFPIPIRNGDGAPARFIARV